jgi:hypothetical protein
VPQDCQLTLWFVRCHVSGLAAPSEFVVCCGPGVCVGQCNLAERATAGGLHGSDVCVHSPSVAPTSRVWAAAGGLSGFQVSGFGTAGAAVEAFISRRGGQRLRTNTRVSGALFGGG